MDAWEAELARGASVTISSYCPFGGWLTSPSAMPASIRIRKSPIVEPADLRRLQALLTDERQEVAVVHRFAPRPEDIVCGYEVLCNLSPRDRDAQMDEWSAMSGELWFFDNQIVWQEHASRVRASLPPEVWTAQHGLYVVDGYLPDVEGRVVSGGPYRGANRWMVGDTGVGATAVTSWSSSLSDVLRGMPRRLAFRDRTSIRIRRTAELSAYRRAATT